MYKNKINRRSFLNRSAQVAGIAGVGSLLSSNALASVIPDPRSVVNIESGKIRGGVADGVHVFRGIPYGADTGGKNRFLPPQPAAKWTGVRDTVEFGFMAPQGGGGPATLPRSGAGARITRELFAPLNSQPHSEDCLYLNICSRGVKKEATRPVMVWLHGGGFMSGSGASSLYDGINLCRRGDVVVVTINHRLGALGYLHLGDLDQDYQRSGMVGMLDIIRALEWVKDNIAQFGGDPNRVMIFGESGGGRKVSTMLALPGAKGLFHSAVVHSGPGLRFSSNETAHLRTLALLDELGISRSNYKKLLDVPFDKIIAAQGKAERKVLTQLPQDASFFERYGWAPVMGPDMPHWPFDPTAPQESIDVPVIVGCNRHESSLFLTPNPRLDNVDENMLRAHVERLVGDKADELIAVYRNAYPDKSLRRILMLIDSDDRYRMDSIVLAERKATLGAAPTYMYRFDWETPVWDGLLMAPHALEIPFVFDNAQLSSAFTGGGPDAVALSAIMAETWISFARTGDPNNAALPTWKPYEENNRATMLFNNDSQLVNDPGRAERIAWQPLRKF
ncbi:carboxylesterase/lipase family protein [Aurantivibrio plasticivorans]